MYNNDNNNSKTPTWILNLRATSIKECVHHNPGSTGAG
jgi:hypothetical protein